MTDTSKMKMIPVARPLLGEPEAEAARRAILSGWVTQGPEVAAFEKEFAEYVGAGHACAVSSCTTALHLALLAVGVKPGDEVIAVSHSFVATANSIRYCGAKPVFVDIEPETYNIAPKLIEKAVSPATSAILCVHQMGMPCDMAAIMEIARQKGLPVVEDAACAIGSEILWNGKWEKIGKPHGDVACFSFHPRKIITTGDGGMITTNRKDWDERFRLLRVHGMSMDSSARHRARTVAFESYVELGFNYRMTDIQAAIGREQLKRLPGIVARRRELGDRYKSLLAGVPGVTPPFEPPWARSNWQSYCVRLSEGADQHEVMQELLNVGVATRRGIMCSHREPVYTVGDPCGVEQRECVYLSENHLKLDESEKAQDYCILLPLYHQLTAEDQSRVAQALEAACKC